MVHCIKNLCVITIIIHIGGYICRPVLEYFICVTHLKDHINPSPLDTLTGLQQQKSDDSVKSQVDEASGVLVGMASGQMEVKVKVKQTETIAGPKVINQFRITSFVFSDKYSFSKEQYTYMHVCTYSTPL